MSDGFDHQLRLDRIRAGERIDLVATEPERERIIRDLDLGGLSRLSGHALIELQGAVVRATGRVQASLTQMCIVTGDPIAAHVDEPFDVKFILANEAVASDSETELGSEDCDVIFHDGSIIELGVAMVDTLALAIDPFPRCAGADAALKAAGILTEAEAGPFAGLAALKEKLDRGD